MIYYLVGELLTDQEENFAVLSIDTEKQVGKGCESEIMSLHLTREEADEEVQRLTAKLH